MGRISSNQSNPPQGNQSSWKRIMVVKWVLVTEKNTRKRFFICKNRKIKRRTKKGVNELDTCVHSLHEEHNVVAGVKVTRAF
ncbi:conserved hypothetical protein [Ricinus communis]|uniref:Uncharacterized protein n=1 Tax=Ricinus communis TaxID=3988 RepID=B9SH55_RICCO|nr:conserved hypothetical protein [Ricinus communis]